MDHFVEFLKWFSHLNVYLVYDWVKLDCVELEIEPRASWLNRKSITLSEEAHHFIVHQTINPVKAIIKEYLVGSSRLNIVVLDLIVQRGI